MGAEDALNTGAQRAYAASAGMHQGHLASVIGHMRHFHMNERFHEALVVAGSSPTSLRGNSLVVGRSGLLTVGRFNISRRLWTRANRSQTRRVLAQENRAIEQLVQPELFGVEPITSGVVFFVAEFSGSLARSPDAPLAISIAIPDRAMQQWLFWESTTRFLERYDRAPAQEDRAIPTLKVSAESKKEGGERG
jgi:hypothetical protein